MDKLMLMKTANEVRKGIVQPYTVQRLGIREDLCPRQRYLRIFILKR